MKLVTRHKVAVAPGAAFGAAGEGSLRICFAQSPERMERAMQRLRDGLRAAGIVVDGMDTGAACRTYNVLLSEERRIAAALIAVG